MASGLPCRSSTIWTGAFAFTSSVTDNDTGPHDIRTVDHVRDCPGINGHPALRERDLDRTFQRGKDPAAGVHQERFFVDHEERDVGIGLQHLDHVRVEEVCRRADLFCQPREQVLPLAFPDGMAFFYDYLFHCSASTILTAQMKIICLRGKNCHAVPPVITACPGAGFR